MTIFISNCTLPPAPVNYVTQPNTRGTFDIIWTCLTILFLCTYSVQHPNVPMPEWKKTQIVGLLLPTWKRICMMIVTLTIPEFLVFKAMEDLHCALVLSKNIAETSKNDGVKWSTTHSFYTNMDGFVIRFPDQPVDAAALGGYTVPAGGPPPNSVAGNTQQFPTRTSSIAIEDLDDSGSLCTSTTKDLERPDANVPSVDEQPATSSSAAQKAAKKEAIAPAAKTALILSEHLRIGYIKLLSRHLSTPLSHDKNTHLVHRVLGETKTKLISKEDTGFGQITVSYFIINMLRLRGQSWALDGPQLLMARNVGLIDRLPDIELEDLDDKNKGDAIVKIITLIQAGWQIIQLIIRAAKGYPSSQIEIVTVAFSVCAFCIYLSCWYKPQDVTTAHYITAQRYPTTEEIIALAKTGPSYLGGLAAGVQYPMPELTVHINFDGEHKTPEVLNPGFFGSVLCGIIFGLLHCAAWNFHFPTLVEKHLWRAASITTSVVPLAFAGQGALVFVGRQWYRREGREMRGSWQGPHVGQVAALMVGQIFMAVIDFAYTLSRIFLVMETVRSLFFLLPGTYLTTI